jgi:putative ABC transport system permease protein
MLKRVPLGWAQLTYEKRRLIAAIAGIAFAAVLMTVQLGFRDSLFEASSIVQDRLQSDLVLISKQYDYLVFSNHFPRQRLYQALAFDGVKSVAPVYMGIAQWKNPLDLKERSILMLGIDPASQTSALRDLKDRRRLLFPDVVMFDRGSRTEFGPIASSVLEKGSVVSELNGRKIQVIDLFQMGVSFGINGSVVTGDLNFLRLMPAHPQDLIEIGLIFVKPGTDVGHLQKQLATFLPGDVRVLTKAQFSQEERDYWAFHTGIGYIFTLGLFIGFVVGGVIVYQILYTDVTDHLPEYATLKAMGYGDRYLSGLVLQEALILSVIGFIPGLLIAKGLYIITEKATLLPMLLTARKAGFVFLLTLGMCCGSALLAIRKLRQADPAEIF